MVAKARCLWWIMICWLLLVAWTAAESSRSEYESEVETECSFTLYPSLCVETALTEKMKNLSGNKPADIAYVLVDKTISATAAGLSPPSIVRHSNTSHHADAESYCDELMDMSLRLLNQSLSALQKSPTRHKPDIQTWLSAVLTYQDNCKDWAASAGDHLLIQKQTITARMDHLSQLGSNALAIINRITGGSDSVTESHDHFPTWVSTKDRKLLLFGGEADAVVAKDGSGDYTTVGEAIKAASGGKGRYVIYVKSGVYKEKIRTSRDGITLIGDGKDSTIIEGSSSVRGGSSLIGSATFVVSGDGFIARDIGFWNTAGVEGEQAIALAVASDHALLYRCAILGHQDTLFAQSLRQFYRECDISGTVDFIFGNAAAVFQSCNILLQKPMGSNAVMASGRTDPGQNTGFSLHRCRVVAGPELAPVKHSYKSYLGRPWRKYARSVVMLSYIDDSIAGRGWVEWPGSSDLGSLYFGEYENTGPGSSTDGRVGWSGFHLMGRDEAEKYTVGAFIGGSSWIPPTGISFVSGL
uniref:Pectinesterase n=1 Tax=Kalanchoe fedtschenkoi TaxID=63787 RepID=A0A7N0TY59_KALFE